MQHHHPPLSVATTLSLSLLLLCLLSLSTTSHAEGGPLFNITRMLAKHPEFSTFNHYLTATHLAAEINRRRTITVCAVDNPAMNALLAHHYPLPTIKNILSLHIFADYFGAKKLHQITKGSTTTSTLFQATGEAAGTSGYVKITDMKGGKVGFSAGDESSGTQATYVKSIEEKPYVIALLQISHVLSTPEAEAPTASPSDINVASLLSKQGCKAFSDLLSATGAMDTFSQSVEGGLTIFCPTDEALSGFTPRYKNLTDANKVSLLLYHGIPVYESLGMLRSSNGVMNTLATEGANKYDFEVQNDGEDVKLKTKVNTATITGTLIDKDPLSVFKLDKVLLPRELFKADIASAPAPKGAKKSKKSSSADANADAPGPAGDDGDVPADSTSDNAATRMHGLWFSTLVGSLFLGVFGWF